MYGGKSLSYLYSHAVILRRQLVPHPYIDRLPQTVRAASLTLPPLGFRYTAARSVHETTR
ncbi:Uncharacterised protein [Vibrio cholerae]|nr:Uncharacterised protein [Vibrio cholerae]